MLMKKTVHIRPLYKLVRFALVQVMLLLVVAGVSPAVDLTAQELLDKRVSLRLENQNLRSILQEIEQQADIRFAFRPRDIPVNQKMTIIANNEALSEILTKLVRPLRLRYEVVGRQIILSPVNQSAKAVVPEQGDALPKVGARTAEQPVSGTVLDEAGQELPGVNVVVKGTSFGTTTDVKGSFKLAVPGPRSVLVFSFLGYEPQEIAVASRTEFRVTLKTDSKALNEVVVVGYGIQKKADLTGAIATISADKFKNKAGRFLRRSAGRADGGVQVQQTNGAPGGEGLTHPGAGHGLHYGG